MKKQQSLGRTFLISRREYLERIRTKTFLITTLITPAMMLGFMFLPDFFMSMKTGGAKNIIVVSDDPAVANAFKSEIEKNKEPKYEVTLDQTPTPAERLKLDSKVGSRAIDGYIWLTRAALASGKLEFHARSASNFLVIDQVQHASSLAAIQQRLEKGGIHNVDTASLTRALTIRTVQVGGGVTDPEALFTSATLLVLILYMTVVVHGVAVMRSIQEEKNTRVMEVILSAVTPKELMAGKILGVGAVGLTQIAIWGLIAVAFMGAGIAAIRGQHLYFTPIVGIFFIVFYLLGFLLYSALAAALGAMANSDDEAQQLQFFLVMPIIMALLLIGLILSDPSSSASIALSLVPFFAPVLMYLRIVLEQPPAWQLALCVMILIASIYVALAASARIYRVGILMYGKRPTLPEIIKWLRQT